MKIKVFSLVLSIFVVLLTAVSCVSLPVENNSSAEESKNTSAGQSSEQNESSGEAAESSIDESMVSPNESSGETSQAEESSEISAEESSGETSQSTVDLPYDSFDGLTLSNIGSSEYDSYFENSMFIGNSIMVHFLNFNTSARSKYPGFLGSCKIFASSNFSALQDSQPVTEDSWHPKYLNTKMTSADAVAASGVDTVYLSVMALNEIALYKASTCVQDNFNTTVQLINSIKAKSPNVKIVILSNTYMVYNYNPDGNKLSNGNLSALNNKVLEYCNQNGLDFIDVSDFLMEGNVMADKYCRDYEKVEGNCGCHLTNDAYCIWTATLRNYSCMKQNNAWKNPDSMPTYTTNK